MEHSRPKKKIVGEAAPVNSELVKRTWLLYTCAKFGELWPTNP